MQLSRLELAGELDGGRPNGALKPSLNAEQYIHLIFQNCFNNERWLPASKQLASSWPFSRF